MQPGAACKRAAAPFSIYGNSHDDAERSNPLAPRRTWTANSPRERKTLHNPDFPNPVAKRQFVLDIDASCSGVPAPEVLDKVKALNSFCEEMFETNIGDGLRAIMEVVQ